MAKKRSAKSIVQRLGIRNTPDAKPKTVRQARTVGLRSGLGITAFWATLFKANEDLTKKKKMTDEEIKRHVIAEFPDRIAVRRLGAVGEKGEVTVNYYRILYNRGRLTHAVIPSPLSRS